MIKLLYGNSDFNDLLQESYLARTSILSGIEYLNKAELFNENADGLFYSAFFSLSIGIERFLKIAIVSEYMYSHNFSKPPNNFLKHELGHNLVKLFNICSEISKKHSVEMANLNPNSLNFHLIDFLSRYAIQNRYKNLNNLTNVKSEELHPLHEWVIISEKFSREVLDYDKLERELFKHYSKFNYVGFTHYLDFNGHPLLSVDLYKYQFLVNKARPYILFNLIQILNPIYMLMDKISFESNNGENAKISEQMRLPYYGELFPFFYTNLQQFKTVKNWINRYN